jgi:hypothetical protein
LVPLPTPESYTPGNRASHAVTAGLLREWLGPYVGWRV